MEIAIQTVSFLCMVILIAPPGCPRHVGTAPEHLSVETRNKIVFDVDCKNGVISWNPEIFKGRKNDLVEIRYKPYRRSAGDLMCETKLLYGGCDLSRDLYYDKYLIEMTTPDGESVYISDNKLGCEQPHGECMIEDTLYRGGDLKLNKLAWWTGARTNCSSRIIQWSGANEDLEAKDLYYTTYYKNYSNGDICPVKNCQHTKSRECYVSKAYERDDIFLLIVERENGLRSDIIYAPTLLFPCSY